MRKFKSIILMMLVLYLGNAHASTDACPNKDVASAVAFDSGATVRLPDGVTASKKGNSFEFSIGNEPLILRLFEFQSDLETAIRKAREEAVPDESRKPQQTLNPPEAGWDSIRIDIYAPDANEKTLQIFGKNKAEFTWVLLVKGTEGLLEKRNAQIQTLLGNLRYPREEILDLSSQSPVAIGPQADDLEAFIHETMAQAQIPGLAIGLIEDGKLAYARGFGVTNLRSRELVSADTRFMIGSTTKSMTTFMISKLADEGILNWHDKALTLDSGFRVKDAKLTQDLRLLDLACACTGMPRHDLPLMFNFQGRTASDLMSDLSLLEATTGFRETFQYNNQLVAASGYLAAKKALPNLDLDKAYYQLMEQYVFGPLKMNRTSVRFDEVLSGNQFAQGYMNNFQGSAEPVDLHFEHFAEYVGPSGGVWSTVSDLAKYIITELNQGLTEDGRRVLSEEGIRVRRQEQVRINDNLHYGLGWMVGKELGLDVVQHGGATMGFNSELIFFPKLKRGIVILTNSANGHLAFGPLANKILGLWYNRNLKATELLRSNLLFLAQTEATLRSKVFTLSPDDMGRYLGRHFNPEIGEIRIYQDGENYFAQIGEGHSHLTGYRESFGVSKLLPTKIPFLYLQIEPIFANGVSIRLTRAQEVYDFTPR